MRFAILGTTRAWRADGQEVAIGGRALRALLAYLLVRPGETVSVDSLVEDLYGDRPALDAGHALQSQISRLRRALAEATIDSLPSGYRLPVGTHQIDVEEFERLSDERRLACLEDRLEAELHIGEHTAAVAELRELATRHSLRERPHGLLMRALV